ncbi:MAG: hypothetical protein LN589_01465 [Rickettsia endosymbiont of Eriopis connexa]|nr:hypothetical protein [Rickettsia endosymbiont of Eriopis connexa]
MHKSFSFQALRDAFKTEKQRLKEEQIKEQVRKEIKKLIKLMKSILCMEQH